MQEFFFAVLGLVSIMIALDAASMAWGVDSRPSVGDDHLR